MTPAEIFGNNLIVYNERSKAVQQLIKNKGITNSNLYKDVILYIDKLTNNIQYIKNNIQNISDSYLRISNDFIGEINNSLLNFSNNQEHDINVVHLCNRLEELTDRAVAIEVGISATLTNEYKVELENFKLQTMLDAMEIKSTKDEVQSQLQVLNDVIEKYKETNRPATENLELHTNAIDFEKVATNYNKQAQNWRIWIIVLIGGLIAVCLSFLYCINSIDLITTNQPINIQNTNLLFYFVLFKNAALRIFIISMLVYLLRFCVINYNASKHNWSINKHKANCLEAAIRIIALSPKEDKVRESIMLLAGKEIFAQQKTGYLNKEGGLDISLIEKLVSLSGKGEK